MSGPEQHPLVNIDQVIHAPARLMVLTYLYVVESVDDVFLMHLTEEGRTAFKAYKKSMQQVLDDLPD